MEHETHSKYKHVIFKLKLHAWKMTSLLLGVIVLIFIVASFFGTNTISKTEAGNKIVDFAATQGIQASLIEVNEKAGMYEVIISMQGKEIPLYVSKDGDYFAQSLVPLSANANDQNNQQQSPSQNQLSANVPKTDKPKVELFVMTHCPYGTQAEKGLIPAVKTLGSNADIKIRFVHYFMHGDKEEKETYNQVCIREEQSPKYWDYLSCFLGSTGSEDDAKKCLDTAKIDKAKLNTCLSNEYKKAKEYYEVDKKLSNQYGVQGSPTLVINGAQAESGRSSEALKVAICSGFTSKPEGCDKDLTSFGNPAPGFGFDTQGGSASAAGCGV